MPRWNYQDCHTVSLSIFEARLSLLPPWVSFLAPFPSIRHLVTSTCISSFLHFSSTIATSREHILLRSIGLKTVREVISDLLRLLRSHPPCIAQHSSPRRLLCATFPGKNQPIDNHWASFIYRQGEFNVPIFSPQDWSFIQRNWAFHPASAPSTCIGTGCKASTLFENIALLSKHTRNLSWVCWFGMLINWLHRCPTPTNPRCYAQSVQRILGSPTYPICWLICHRSHIFPIVSRSNSVPSLKSQRRCS